MKLCKDCRYNVTPSEQHECEAPEALKPDYVNGGHKYAILHLKDMREFAHLCGPTGKWYSAKDGIASTDPAHVTAIRKAGGE